MIVILTVTTLISRGSQQLLAKRIAQSFRPEEVLAVTTKANFEGLESEGAIQLRGRCAAVLLRDKLLLLRAYPYKEYLIPIESITQVVQSSQFLSKRYLRPITVVRFVHDEQLDAIGFSLKEGLYWEEAIKALLPSR